MVSDSIVLELLERIQKCENDIKELTKELSAVKNGEGNLSNQNELEEELEDGQRKITRGIARELVINNIRSLLPDAKVYVGTRNNGSGIVVQDSKGIRKYKFYYSRTYDISADNIISWSGVMKEDIDQQYDGYIFSIWSNDKQYVLLFTHSDLLNVINATKKTLDTNDKYHFSFTIISGGQVLETRSPNNYDVSSALNNYKII